MIAAGCAMLNAQDNPGLSAQAPATEKAPLIGEVFLFGGGTIKPARTPALGGGFGVGWGERPMVTFEVGYARLGDYAVGFGTNLFPDGSYPVSKSRQWDISGNFQIEAVKRRLKPRIAPYATFGLGYVTGKFTIPKETCCTFPRPPGAVEEDNVNKLGVGLGGGTRIRIKGGVGIRPELKFWITKGGQQQFGTTTTDSLIRVTLAIYRRGAQARR
jgi:hypothetical protein